uniref:F-box domain-containing protein n=1 Tax=Moniliophthora roreri TaxID=221103 RepID=A0A0W0GF06_MONRR
MPHRDLPFELWLRIAEFIPEQELVYRLRNVSHHFRNIALQIQYRNVELLAYNKGTKKLLDDLKQPDLRGHVRSVRVKPWIIPHAVKLSSKRAKLWHKVNTVLDADYPCRRACARLQHKLSKHISRVSDTIRNLPSAQEYRIEWCPTSFYHPEFFSAFLAPLLVGTEFGRNITKFSVQVPVEKLTCLARVSLPSLTHLELQLHTGAMLTGEVNDRLDSLIVFINNTFSTLRSLSVASTSESERLDLNRFFHLLGFFTKLIAFSLSTPYNGAHVASPSYIFTSNSPAQETKTYTPLEAFVKKHSDQLEELRLKCSRAVPVMNNDPDADLWVQRILVDIAGGGTSVEDDGNGILGAGYGLGSTSFGSDNEYHPLSPTSPASCAFSTTSTMTEAYPRLEVLEIPVRPLKHTLQPLLACLQAVGGHLKSLTLTERTLTDKEVEVVMNALAFGGQCNLGYSSYVQFDSSRFSCPSTLYNRSTFTSSSPPLRHLSLRILTLSHKVMDSLAIAAPNLKTLELDLRDVGIVNGQAFAIAMKHRLYEDWTLCTLLLRNDTFKLPYLRRGGGDWFEGIANAMKASVPALEDVKECSS